HGRRVCEGEGRPGPLRNPARPRLRVHRRLRATVGREERDRRLLELRPRQQAGGRVAEVSTTHGDRAKAAHVLKALTREGGGLRRAPRYGRAKGCPPGCWRG